MAGLNSVGGALCTLLEISASCGILICVVRYKFMNSIS